MSARTVETNRYDGAATGWASGASLVYAPLARELAARSPHPLTGRRVLDVGAGTGVGSDALLAAGAQPIALDLSWDMLTWRQDRRPPAIVARVDEPPVATAAIDDVFASFVLNHVNQPVETIRALARVVRPGGALLASTYANSSRSAARDRIDEVAVAHGFDVPAWYVELKARVTPLLGSASAMRDAAHVAGLDAVDVEERAVDVGVDRAEDLVRYRLGQAQYAPFIASLDPEADAALRRAAVAAVAPIMEPYRPIVVFLVATVS